MGTYSISVVGESFANDDGSSRQAEIRRCKVGEAVSLIRDPDNLHDANCVRVVSTRGAQIGNIGRKDDWICERLDAGRYVEASIEFVGEAERGKLGVVLSVVTDKGVAKKPAPSSWEQMSVSEKGTGVGCLVLIVLAVIAAIALAI